MMTRLSLVGIACVLSIASWAQTQQQGAAARAATPAPNAANQGQQAGTVRNDRNATMPRVGVSAVTNTASELVGCIAKNDQAFVLTQPVLSRSYQLRGNQGLLNENAGRLVRVSGRLLFGTPASFDVQQVQVIQPKCDYAQTAFVLPATGGTGAEGVALNVTSTATEGRATPGVETQAGMKQNASLRQSVQSFGAYTAPLAQRTESQGAPPDPRYENPAEAERIANAASRSEMQNGRQLGVNAEPNYSAESNPQQTEQLTANEAQQFRGQATDSTRVLQGGGAPANSPNGAQESAIETAPVFSGCITQHDNKLVLLETATHQQYTIDAAGNNLGHFVNQQVRMVGNITGTYGSAVGTDGNNATVHVISVRAEGSCSGK